MPMHPSTPHLPPVIPDQRRSSAMRPATVAPAQRSAAHRLAVPQLPAPRPASPPVIPAPRQPPGGGPVVGRRPAPAQERTTTQRPPAQAPDPATATAPVDDRMSRTAAVLDVVAQMGSGVMLSALLVLATAVGGLVDGQPSNAGPLTITFDDGP